MSHLICIYCEADLTKSEILEEGSDYRWCDTCESFQKTLVRGALELHVQHALPEEGML